MNEITEAIRADRKRMVETLSKLKERHWQGTGRGSYPVDAVGWARVLEAFVLTPIEVANDDAV